MRSPAIANDFDITPSEIPRGKASAPASSRSGLVELEEPVDLVGQQVAPAIGGDRRSRSAR